MDLIELDTAIQAASRDQFHACDALCDRVRFFEKPHGHKAIHNRCRQGAPAHHTEKACDHDVQVLEFAIVDQYGLAGTDITRALTL
jgi:hypothetical protein